MELNIQVWSFLSEDNIPHSIDISGKKEYNYEYEEGRIVRATESDIELNANEIVISKTLLNSVRYYYNDEGQMTKKVITFANGSKHTVANASKHTVYYEAKDDNNVVRFTVGDKTVMSHSKTDSFGRKIFDELQLGTGFVSREFSYCTGAVTDTVLTTTTKRLGCIICKVDIMMLVFEGL